MVDKPEIELDDKPVDCGRLRDKGLMFYPEHYDAMKRNRDEFRVYAESVKSALTESVRLQSHYAWLLNQYDGGNRKGFANAQEWMERLAATKI